MTALLRLSTDAYVHFKFGRTSKENARDTNTRVSKLSNTHFVDWKLRCAATFILQDAVTTRLHFHDHQHKRAIRPLELQM